MHERQFRRLPVVNKDDQLVGIISERDLLHASPSPATSLSVWEMNYLLSKLTVDEVMTGHVIAVNADTPIEEAAGIMVDHRIGGLAVVDEGKHVIGVITETDVFRAFVEMLGGSQHGLRLMLNMQPRIGTLAKLTTAIAALDGDIVSVGTFAIDETEHARLLIKVTGVSQDQLVETLEALGDQVLDVREV